MRCSDLSAHFGGQTSIVCLLQQGFMEQDRHSPAAALRSEPRMHSKTLDLYCGIALPQLSAEETRTRDFCYGGNGGQSRTIRLTPLLTESNPILPGNIYD